MTSPPEIRVLDGPAELFQAAAAEFTRLAADAVRGTGRFTVALSGGSTPKTLYSRLATDKSLAIPWDKVCFFFGDERHVPPDHTDSNYHMAKLALLDRVPIPPGNVLRMRGEDPPEAAADAYSVELRRELGDDGRLDLVLLGLGHDGHTASLFPGLAAVTETRRTAMASYVEFVGMWRLSLTPVAINAARRVVFVVTGDDKADILQRVLQGPRQPVVLPAQAIRPTARPAIWLLDRVAAAKLKGKH